MTISEMLKQLIQMGHLAPRQDVANVRPFGSYKEVPSITIYGTPVGPSMTTGPTNAELEQRSS